MSIADELLAHLARFAQRAPLPGVRALHLPPVAGAAGKEGEFCALELDDGSIGLSYVLLDDALARLGATGADSAVHGADALAVARQFARGTGLARLLGFAAANALTACLFERAGYVPDATADSIGLADPRPGDHVGMVGLFKGLAGRIVQSGARLTVVELKPELAGERDGYRVTLDADELRDCNKLLSTSSILINDTVDRIVACGARAGTFAVIGPGAGCLPDPLFTRGVTLLGGTRVVDRPAFIDALRAGTPWGASAAKFAIRREDYPGAEALLARV